MRNKLNHFITGMPYGVVLTLSWLKEQGVSCKLAWWYTQSHWLERLGSEAYKKPGDNITWIGALSAVQNQLQLPIHVGAKTALELLGRAHFIPIKGIKRPVLFNNSNSKVPQWLLDYHLWNVEFLINKAILFQDENSDLGIIQRKIDGIDISLSSPERAIFEVLSLVPHKQTFDEATKLMEGLSQLRPDLVQSLLEQCKSIKTKRLFLYLAEHFQHPWLTRLNLTKVDLGRGKRVIDLGGNFDSKYQISVPKIAEE